LPESVERHPHAPEALRASPLLWIPTRNAPNPELKLAISLDVEGGGWLVEMITSSFTADGEPAYSRTVIPMYAIEQGTTDAYIDALFIALEVSRLQVTP
jgi:hypothetical protein